MLLTQRCQKVYLYSGVNRTVGSFGDFADQRSFAVLPGMQLIGLTGEVTTVRPYAFLSKLPRVLTHHVRTVSYRVSAFYRPPIHHLHPY
jgi:hypothetical protein